MESDCSVLIVAAAILLVPGSARPGDYDDVIIGMLFAQLVANKQVEKDSSVDWYDAYSNVGYFQMIPCVMNSAHKVDMGIYHRQFKIQRNVSRFLFIENESLEYESIEQMACITFNTLHYADFREKVKHSVLSKSLKYLEDLDI